MAKKTLDYSSALEQLKKIAADLESQKVPLEKLPKTLEEAAELLQFCRNKLRTLEEGMKNAEEKTEGTNN
jgi:exodeoxyribonuclease VII small subunit